MRRFLLTIILIFSLFSAASAEPIQALNPVSDNTVKNLLYLSSSDSRCIDAQKMFQAFIEAVPEYYNIHYQPLDWKIAFSDTGSDIFDAWYAKFIESASLDAIICADPYALKFVMEKRKTLFKGIPILAQGLVRTPYINIISQAPKTFIIEDLLFIDENIKLINSLFPRRRKIVFIGSEEHHKKLIEDAGVKYDIETDFYNISGMNGTELMNLVRKFNQCAIVFIPSATELNHNILDSEKALEIITS